MPMRVFSRGWSSRLILTSNRYEFPLSPAAFSGSGSTAQRGRGDRNAEMGATIWSIVRRGRAVGVSICRFGADCAGFRYHRAQRRAGPDDFVGESHIRFDDGDAVELTISPHCGFSCKTHADAGCDHRGCIESAGSQLSHGLSVETRIRFRARCPDVFNRGADSAAADDPAAF